MAKTKSTAAAENVDPYELGRKLAQMHAATIAISGGGFESFSEMSDELKDNYLCMLADLAGEAIDIYAQLKLHRRPGFPPDAYLHVDGPANSEQGASNG